MLIDKLKLKGHSLSKVRSIYVFTTVFLVGLSIYTFIQILHLFEASALIQHTSEVKESLQTISITLLDAESNKRGYLLSGDSSLVYKKEHALQVLKTEHDVLAELLKDNVEQSNNLQALDSAIQRKLLSLNNIWNNGSPLPVTFSLKENVDDGVEKMDSVRLYLDRMNLAESQLYAKRSQVYSRLSVITPIYIIVLFLGALLILFFSYFRLNSELRESQLLHSALKEQNQGRLILGEELIMANQELAFQIKEKEERASELTIANTELAFQNEEKEKRAAELAIANLELGFQNAEKEKRAAELAIANLELGFQNETKEKLARELIIANHELAFQNEEKEKRAVELFKANKELQLFLNISSHDLQEPLRKIQMSASRIEDADFNSLSPKGKDHFVKMQEAARSMQTLIEDLLTYSRTNTEERIFEFVDLDLIIEEVKEELKEAIDEKQAIVEITDHCEANVIPFQFRQLIYNMLSNALKFSIPGKPPHILISSCIKKGRDCKNEKLLPDQEYCHITIKDNGIGFEPEYSEKIFEVFQRLYGKEVYKGTGIGLAIVKKIVENHNGVIIATSQLNQGATFDIYIPTKTSA
ncbi:MAG: CHASE3 domain-containing protein [Saprospiraceae bacterium]|nr:CHASE3 domain-containing protein [Saprospiraceae bacterium]